MAKITEEASATVSMNMEPARKEFDEWTQKVEEGRRKLEELLAVPEKKRDNKAIKQVEADIAQAEKRAKSCEEKLRTFRDTLKNLDSASMNQLYKASKQLEAQLKRLKPGTEEFIAASKDLKTVNTRIKTLRDSWKAVNEEQKATTLSLKGMADGFNKYFGMATTAIAAITGVSMAFRKCAEEAAKLDDIYADVMKTTGLMHDQVEALDKALMQIDTRTSREQLLLLARDAGKLGITGTENILGFVRAADQIQVALGEDLGEGAIRNLGKIADVLGYTDSMGIEKALLSIGSAVNAVGQASTASEAYLVDFTQRLAGVAAQANISAADIIGFASGLDQSAMKVEMAATAFQKFLMKMYEDPAKFANLAGMQVKEFSDLLQNDANKAITTVLKALKDQDGFAAMVPIFNDMGLDGARAVSVLASMASNLDAVTEAQALANVEFAKATSLTEEYNTKNNNLQAQLEKARKEFHNASITLGQSLNPIMLKSTKALTYLIKALANYGKEIKTVLIVIAALTVAFKAKVIWMKIVATWNATLKAGALALAAAKALLTGNIQAATAAWAAMSAVMKTTIFGLVAAAIAGLVIWLQHLNKETENLTKLEKFEKQLHEDLANVVSDEAARVKALQAILEDSNQSYADRKAALDELKEMVPEYHANLTEEGVLINNNVEALNNYIDAVLQAARTQALKDKLMENANKQFAEEEYLLQNAPEEFRDALGEWRYSYTTLGEEREDGTRGVITHMISADCEAAITRLKEFKQEEEVILDMIREVRERFTSPTTSPGGGGGGGGGGLDPKEAKKAYDAAVALLQQNQRQQQNLINRQYFNQEITAQEHEAKLREIKMQGLLSQLELAKKYGQDTSQIEANILTEQSNARKAEYGEELKEVKAHYTEEENALKLSLAAGEITQEQYDAEMLQLKMMSIKDRLALAQDYGQDETAILQEYLNAQFEAQKAANEKMAAMRKEAKKILKGLNPSEARDAEMQEQLARLDALHEASLLSEQQYEEAVKQLRKKYAEEDLKEKLDNVQKYVNQVNSIMTEASNFATALKEAESAKLEAQYQADLTAAGDNAERKEEIEAEYEEKKLELSKKYADTEMVINIAKTIAAGALAAIQAFAQLGPIAGGVMAAIIAATTAAEVYTIVQQRNAIKNSSVSSSSSSGSTSATVVTPTGYAEGGYTKRSASDHKAVGVVHANEYVVPAWMVRKNPVMIANLEQYRRTGNRSRSRSNGFSEGGFTSGGSTASDELALKTLAAIERLEANTAANTAAINQLMDEGVQAFEVYDQRQSFETQRKRFKNATKR